jgi:pimeloyl-ACP methyl ester carboxylesterase
MTKRSTAQPKKHAKTSFGEIAYTDRGSGPVALFVHGVFQNGYFWRHVIDRVADIRRCIAIDLLSYGDSPAREDQDISLRAQAQMLESFCASLGLDQVDLVANGIGGGISQIFAARHPERIRSLTLANCVVHDNYPPPAFARVRNNAAEGLYSQRREEYRNDVKLFRPGLKAVYENVDTVSDETIRIYVDPLFATPVATRNLERWLISSNECSGTVEVEPLLKKLTTPTLIVWGTADPFFAVEWAHWLKKTIPGAREVIELEGAKLSLPEEWPDALASALRAHWKIEASQAAS